MRQIIKRPFITEKSTIQNAAGVYIFEVDLSATKDEVRTAIEKSFDVKVDRIRTVRGRGRAKTTRFGKGAVSYYKKAFVKLKQGEKISLFEGA